MATALFAWEVNSAGGQSDWSAVAQEHPATWDIANAGPTSYGDNDGPPVAVSQTQEYNSGQWTSAQALSGNLEGYAPDGGEVTFEYLPNQSEPHGNFTVDPTTGDYSYFPDGSQHVAYLAFRVEESQNNQQIESNLADLVLYEYGGPYEPPTVSDGMMVNSVGGSPLLTPGLPAQVPASAGLIPSCDSSQGYTYTASLVENGPNINASVNANGSFNATIIGAISGWSWFTYKVTSEITDPGTEELIDTDSAYATIFVESAASPVATAPVAPTIVSAKPTNFSQITLNWTRSPNAVSYEIQREDNDSGSFNIIAVRLPANQLSYKDNTVVPGSVDYTYEVIAVNIAGSTAASTPATVAGAHVTVAATQDGTLDGDLPSIFTISRDGDVSESLTVYYTLAGTGKCGPEDEPSEDVDPEGSDYYGAVWTHDGANSVCCITIPAGQQQVQVVLTPEYGSTSGGNVSISLTLVLQPSYLGAPTYGLSQTLGTAATAMQTGLDLNDPFAKVLLNKLADCASRKDYALSQGGTNEPWLWEKVAQFEGYISSLGTGPE